MNFFLVLNFLCINKEGSRNSYIIFEILNNMQRGKSKEEKGKEKGKVDYFNRTLFFLLYIFFLSLYLLHF